MSKDWIFKPVVFFGKRIYILFSAAMSIPVWLASNNYLDGLSVPDDEAAATGVTMCFFAGIFTGRYLAQIWLPHLQVRPRKLILSLSVFILVCTCWLFIHADFPLDDMMAINLLLYWLPFMATSLATGVLIKAIRSLTEKELNEARSSAAHSESELRLLQSQLSPHFLFNTLNNMYGLSLTEHQKVPALLLKLSELLRYSVYEANETYVSLRSETGYLKNYIEFEKIRLGERLSLKTDIEPSLPEDFVIAPMLLIVFVENAFKHSRNSVDDNIYIDINLKVWNDQLLFSVKNSYSPQQKRFDKNSGLGLDNVRKRLELLYPGAYALDIRSDEQLYTIMLQVKLKK